MDVVKIRKEFPFFDNNKNIIYFDNASTSLRLKKSLDKIKFYYENLSVNSTRGDYDKAYLVDKEIDESRSIAASFINAKKDEIIFTSGATMSINLVANGIEELLKKDDEIIIGESEHSSNMLPWINIAKKKSAKIKFIDLVNGKLDVDQVVKLINEKTKLISISHTSNTFGETIDIENIIKKIRGINPNILISIDAAQSALYQKIDVKLFDCDFLSFSSHKLGGPSGVGVCYIKKELQEKIKPLILGGGDNKEIKKNLEYKLYSNYQKFEAGTLNIEGILGFKEALKFINKIGKKNILKRSKEIRNYALLKMKNIKNVEIYNKFIDSTTILFNIKDVFAQDAASFFNKYNICLRAGQHCARLVPNHIKTHASLRASFSYYNTKEEVDKFIEVLKKGDDFLEAFF